MTPLSYALEYAELGLPVLPLHTPDPRTTGGCDCRRRNCSSPGKHPRTLRGVHDATTDPDTIRRWWRMWPDANVGIATGYGVVVLDVDPRNGGAESLAVLEAEHGPIRAPAVRTGGGGWHIYMHGDAPARSGFRPGLDLKAKGGYVVAPPSLHVSGARYEWANRRGGPVQATAVPDWLREILDPPRPAWAPPARTVEPLTPAYVSAAIERECIAVANAPVGTRNDRLNRAAFALARFVAAGHAEARAVMAALEVAARAAGLEEREIRRTIESAFRAREVAA